MGCTVKEQIIVTYQTPISKIPGYPQMSDVTRTSHSIIGLIGGKNKAARKPDIGSSHDPSLDHEGWAYCTQEQLGEILLNNLVFLYNNVVVRLVDLGYKDADVLKAVLRNGHYVGGVDMLINMWNKCLAYLDGSGGSGNENSKDLGTVFENLKQLGEFSLASMVTFLQKDRPQLSRGAALWCLLMSDLDVVRAKAMKTPVSSGPAGIVYSVSFSDGDNVGISSVGKDPGACQFHGGLGFGKDGGVESPIKSVPPYNNEVTQKREFEFPKRFNLTPSMESMLKKKATRFAVDYRANSKQIQGKSQACLSTAPGREGPAGATSGGVPVIVNQSKELQDSETQDLINSMINNFRDLDLNEMKDFVYVAHDDRLLLSLIYQIRIAEKQLEDRKEWAREKAMQAAKKLSNDLAELKISRMEKEETLRAKNAKQILEDSILKKFTEMENSLRKGSGEVDRANKVVKRLESENAEIRAEMEASKLSASESITTCLEVAKREKKCLKKGLAWEKQKAKLQEEINGEKEKIVDLQQHLDMIGRAQKEVEVKLPMEIMAKEQALAQVLEEQSSKKAIEAKFKRNLEDLRLNTGIDFERQRDDLRRLKQELSQLKVSVEQSKEIHPSNTPPPMAKFDTEMASSFDDSFSRNCLICLREEVTIVFIPCAHQVLCCNCNASYGTRGMATCPCCRTPIQQRLRVYGAST